MLSIDIGLKNLGYAVFKYPEPGNESGILSFDILNVDKQIDKSKPLTVARALVLREFIKELFQTYDIKKVIIEKQGGKFFVPRFGPGDDTALNFECIFSQV